VTQWSVSVVHIISVCRSMISWPVMTNEMTAEITIAEYQQNVNELWDALMGFEMQLVEELEVSFCCS